VRLGRVTLGGYSRALIVNIALSTDAVFVTLGTNSTLNAGGLWRVPKTGGTPVEWATNAQHRYAYALSVVGDRVYFTDGATLGASGGLWWCLATSSCTPQKVVALNQPYAMGDDGSGYVLMDQTRGLLHVETDGGTTVIDSSYTGVYPDDLIRNASGTYYATTYSPSTTGYTRVIQIHGDGGFDYEDYYVDPNATTGRLVHDATGYYASGWRFGGNTADGVVKRVYGNSCVLGATDDGHLSKLRPHGLALDSTRLYWANQGEGAGESAWDTNPATSWTGGSIVYCEKTGCCATPTKVTDAQEPSVLAVDNDVIYYGTLSGEIWKIAKP
jgi:hypothetical protein